ncbi:Protein containing plastocyanin/azurin family domain [Pseudoalteromonas luteoviolacea B = ATCC 29581]|nr:Protein containing plastocyanin/azurin family domain [Pseudoalteromonas luteoviolacea B = ATCC 29581]
MKKRLCLLLASVLGVTPSLWATTITITDSDGKPLENAVVWLTPKETSAFANSRHYEMGQKDRTFTPHILPVPKGASVDFPNFDDILHHVYSFSDTKPFELKLYRDKPHAPIQFETTGVVELGCNIHDWMLGYIVVVDSPYFALTNKQGIAQLTLPAEDYQLAVWHERFADLNTPERLNWQSFDSETKLTYAIKQRLVDKFELLVDEFDDYE